MSIKLHCRTTDYSFVCKVNFVLVLIGKGFQESGILPAADLSLFLSLSLYVNKTFSCSQILNGAVRVSFYCLFDCL